MKHTVDLQTMPLGTNNLYFNRGNFRVMTPKARANKAAIAAEGRASYRGEPVDGPLRVEIALRWPTRRNHDVDNIKVLLDALTGIFWVDDGQIVDLRITKEYDKANPGVRLVMDSL